jgi:hypothetical protein
VQAKLLRVSVVVLAVLAVIALAVRDHHSPTRDSFVTSTTAAPTRDPVAVSGTRPSSAPLARVILCTDASVEPECQQARAATTTTSHP